jgi:hypothetical protein
VNTDVEFALFEADHGSPRRALALARAAWAKAPSVRSADALGWALTRSGRPADGRSWARRALALGTKEPSFLAHAAIAGVPGTRAAALRSVALSPLLRAELTR